jgi:hypothetical protein
MHILLPIRGKFTRAQIAHQIFFFKLKKILGEFSQTNQKSTTRKKFTFLT